jgi:hypothetical protein
MWNVDVDVRAESGALRNCILFGGSHETNESIKHLTDNVYVD